MTALSPLQTTTPLPVPQSGSSSTISHPVSHPRVSLAMVTASWPLLSAQLGILSSLAQCEPL